MRKEESCHTFSAASRTSRRIVRPARSRSRSHHSGASKRVILHRKCSYLQPSLRRACNFVFSGHYSGQQVPKQSLHASWAERQDISPLVPVIEPMRDLSEVVNRSRQVAFARGQTRKTEPSYHARQRLALHPRA